MTNIAQLHAQPAPTFEDFWKAYWRKIDKPLTKAKWEAITSPGGLTTRTLDRDSGEFVTITLEGTPEEIMAGLKRYNRQLYENKTELKFVKHPATWLNRGSWME